MKKSVLAIVPARGGSKRIPRKNIINFVDKPMISYSLEAASKSGIFDKIHVSTDDQEIADVSTRLGFKPDFMRDASLSDDHTPLQPVMKWVIEKYQSMGMKFDYVVLLMATAPLLKAEDLKKAFELFESQKAQFPVITVSEFPVPVEWAFRRDDKGFLSAVDAAKLDMRSQDLQKAYYDTGTFTVYRREQILESQRVGDNRYLSYVLPKGRTVDIDSVEDLRFAEMLYRVQNNVIK